MRPATPPPLHRMEGNGSWGKKNSEIPNTMGKKKGLCPANARPAAAYAGNVPSARTQSAQSRAEPNDTGTAWTRIAWKTTGQFPEVPNLSVPMFWLSISSRFKLSDRNAVKRKRERL